MSIYDLIFYRYSTRPPQHPHLLQLQSPFLAFRCWLCLCSIAHVGTTVVLNIVRFCSTSIYLSHNSPLQFFQLTHIVPTLCPISTSIPPFPSTTGPKYLKCMNLFQLFSGCFHCLSIYNNYYRLFEPSFHPLGFSTNSLSKYVLHDSGSF